jgi:hypothetical protein
MTINEFHIGLDLGLQEINSALENDFGVEEKDYLINEEIKKFVSQRLNPKSNLKGVGFEDTTKRLDDLHTLKKEKYLPTYTWDVLSIGNTTAYNSNVFAFLPSDYLHKIEINPEVYYNCNINSYVETATSFGIAEYSLPTNYDYSPFRIELEVNGTYITIFTSATYPYINAGINIEYWFYIKDLIRDVISYTNLTGLEVYWEQLAGTFGVGRLYFLSSNSSYTNIRITAASVSTIPFSAVSAKQYNLANKKLKVAEGRVYNSEVINDRLRDSFTKTSPISVVCEITKGLLRLYHNEQFYIQNVGFKYYKKPMKVNHNLNITSDLDENVHHEILNNTITTIKSLINSNTYKQFLTENLKIE